jgi:ADP-dependent NAD(P)H-hydrate dehydratase
VNMPNGLPRLPPRAPNAHKGDFGRALLIGGSRGMAGAIALAGMSCLRSGAGLVKLAVPECVLDTVASYEPSYMTVPLQCDRAGHIRVRARRRIDELGEVATCVACGPGLGQAKKLITLVRTLYESLRQPMVIDADGLNALAASDDGLANPAGPRILTPHPGEFARLAKFPKDSKPTREEQIANAKQLAAEHKIVILLKGHRTPEWPLAAQATSSPASLRRWSARACRLSTPRCWELMCMAWPAIWRPQNLARFRSSPAIC